MSKEGHGLLERFRGDGGTRRLEDALRNQVVVEHSDERARDLAKCTKLVAYEKGDEVLGAGGTDTDICLILVGSVAVDIRGHEIASRHAGEHVGEMATIDPTAVRSATVRALEPTVVARVLESDFAAIAARHPAMWRCLALELAERLRQRSDHLRQKNQKPTVFLGSSAEQLAIPRAIQSACQHDPWTVRVWTDGVFGAGKTPIESLVAQLDTLDFGIVVVTPDDFTASRGKEAPSPRDNVVFELGLLMGCLGRARTFMAIPLEARSMKLPSDLVGVQPLCVTTGDEAELQSRIGPAVTEFRSIVKKLGCR